MLPPLSPQPLSCWHQIVKGIFILRTVPSPGPRQMDTALASWKSGSTYSKLDSPLSPQLLTPGKADFFEPEELIKCVCCAFFANPLSQNPKVASSLWEFLVKFSLNFSLVDFLSLYSLCLFLLWPLQAMAYPLFSPQRHWYMCQQYIYLHIRKEAVLTTLLVFASFFSPTLPPPPPPWTSKALSRVCCRVIRGLT